MEVLVFGGTAEGRELVEWLSSLDACDIVSCTATEYGGELVDGLERVTSLVGPLDAEAKERLVAEHDFTCIVDATHPYATHVTESIATLATAHGLPRLRLLRDGFVDGPFKLVADVDEAAQALSRLYNDPKLRSALGAAAKESILAQYSVANFRKSVLSYLSGKDK